MAHALGGAVSSLDVEQELERRRPGALIVGACSTAEQSVLEVRAHELTRIAHEAGVSLAFVGLGGWPDEPEGAARLCGFREMCVWMEQVRASR